MFYIDPDNSIIFGEFSPEDASVFDSAEELATIAEAREWTKQTVTAIWNGFAGVAGPFSDLKPQKCFKNRGYGLAQIWKAIQRLDPTVLPHWVSEPAAAAEAALVPSVPIMEEVAKVTKPKKKAAKAKAKPATKKKTGAKRDELIRLVSRKNGATAEELQEALGWQAHSLRGAISTMNSKGVAKIESFKDEKRGRVYRIAA